MKKTFPLLIAFITILFLSACGSSKPAILITPSPSVTPTPDPCSTSNLPATIKPVNDLMRQFDDYAALASNTPQSQLVQVIPPMQAIHRAAQDQAIPGCLQTLKKNQLLYMDTSIQVLLAFESKANTSILDAGIAQAKQYHNQYTLELASLLGITVVVPTANPMLGTGTPSAGGTQTTPPSAETTPAPTSITIVNPGPNPVNLHVSASLTSQTVGTLDVGQSAVAIGKSVTGEWILMQVPGQTTQTVWVYTTLVKFSSGDIGSLPVSTPAP